MLHKRRLLQFLFHRLQTLLQHFWEVLLESSETTATLVAIARSIESLS
jgi:hypothetical protein